MWPSSTERAKTAIAKEIPRHFEFWAGVDGPNISATLMIEGFRVHRVSLVTIRLATLGTLSYKTTRRLSLVLRIRYEWPLASWQTALVFPLPLC